MASACVSEDLTCSICLAVFTEPVMLLCGHSFCRECISASLNKQHLCPHCRAPVLMEGQYLLTNHILKNLVEKTKEASKLKLEYKHDKEKGEWLCPEHDEKLKLYCITDQQLICVICTAGQRHQSHKFKPVSEAATLLRTKLEGLIKNVSADTSALEEMVQSQTEEINKTRRRSQVLISLISTQFETMYNFLKKKEIELNDKVKCDEKDGVEFMTKMLNAIEAAMNKNKKQKETLTSVLGIQETEEFLMMWSEEKKAKASMGSFSPKSGHFRVDKAYPLSLGPYESHMQMFVWKEMLEIIKPREENILLQSDQTSLNVPGDRRSLLICGFQQRSQHYPRYDYSSRNNQHNESTKSTNTLSGQHYWEVSVGQIDDWELGLPKTFLKMCNHSYYICTSGCSTRITVQGKLNKIGFYLNCPQKELSFYNADDMTHIYTVNLASASLPVLARFKLGKGCASHDPMTVCQY